MKYIIKTIFLFTLNLFSTKAYEFHLVSNLLHIKPECAVSLVKASTAILPKFDSISHIVLNTNDMLINQLLDSNFDPALKKKLILQVIKMTKEGDDMGGHILEHYYKFIDYLL